MAQIETDLTDYQGTLNAFTFEKSGPGPQFPPSTVIRTDQDWGVQIDWTMEGPLTEWIDANFHINVYLESMGPGPEFALPPLIINTKSVPVALVGGAKQRSYSEQVLVNAGDIPAGVYRVVTTLHLFEAASGTPTPVAGFIDNGMVNLFDPA
jgi:hypothetical protein